MVSVCLRELQAARATHAGLRLSPQRKRGDNLQKILGHFRLVMTIRYAHLAPDHLQDAVRFGPLSSLWFRYSIDGIFL